MPMKHTILAFAAALVIAPSAAQVPSTCMLFDAGFLNNSIGGVVQTSDGGVALCGGFELGNTGYPQILVTKVGANGTLQWMKSYDSGPNTADYGLAIVGTDDGGVAVAGYLDAGMVYILKLSATGDQEWAKTYAYSGLSLTMNHNGFIHTADGGFALQAGAFASDGWFMLRTDGSGNVLWSDELAFVNATPTDVAELPNGDLLFTGWDSGIFQPELVLRKDGLTGATEWMHWYSPAPDEYIETYGMVAGADSTIVISGITSAVGYTDAFAMAIASDGTILWATRFGTEEIESGDDVALHPDGGYVITGPMWESPGSTAILGGYVTRLDENGQVVWSKHVSKPDALYIIPTRCSVANDGGVLLAGRCARTNDYPQFFMKLDTNGNSCPTCPSVDEGAAHAMAISTAPDQGSSFTGPWATATAVGFIVVDLTPTAVAEVCGSTGVEDVLSANAVSIAPNPFSDQAVITVDPAMLNGAAWIELRDVLGRLVHTQPLQGRSTVIERNAMATGHYTYRIMTSGGNMATGALVLGER